MTAYQHVQAEMRALRRVVYVGLVVLVVIVVAVGWTTDYRSCLRQQPVREAAQANATQLEMEASYWQARGRLIVARSHRERARVLRSEERLSCFGLIPGT